MNRNQIAELLKYSSPKSILVVTYKNELKEMQCPFWVLVKHDVGNLRKGVKVHVEMVKLSPDLVTVFVIVNTPYYYWYFEIIIGY